MSLDYSFPSLIKSSVLILSLVLFFGIVSHAQALYNLEVYVGDTAYYPGEENIKIPVYIKNLTDTVAAFNLWFNLSRPDIVQFRADTLDKIDVEGTLIEDWEYIDAVSISGTGQDINVKGKSDLISPPDYTPGIGYPQYGEIPLFYLLADAFILDDTITERSASIRIAADLLDYYGFSDEQGKPIGIITDTIEVTRYFICEAWIIPDEVCAYWTQVDEEDLPPEGPDSIRIDTVEYSYVDRARCCDPESGMCDFNVSYADCADMYNGNGVWYEGNVRIGHGSIEIKRFICGDVTNNAAIDILDIVHLINYIYKGGDPPYPMAAADVNGDGSINILDIVALIMCIYKGDCSDVNCVWPE